MHSDEKSSIFFSVTFQSEARECVIAIFRDPNKNRINLVKQKLRYNV